jgi:CYTH domain-containing protein
MNNWAVTPDENVAGK